MYEPYVIFYQSAMIISLIASLCVTVLVWRRRWYPGTRAMTALSIATFIWTLGFFLEANSDTLARQLFFNNIGYIGSMSVPLAWFIFALHYTSGKRLLTRWKILALCIIPLITITLVWSNNLHNLMWSNEHLSTSGPFIVTVKTYEAFFWVALSYNYILVVTGAIILIQRLFTRTFLYRGQVISLIVAVSLPLIWNVIYIFNLLPLPQKDLTPATFAISGLAIVLGIMRFRLFATVPFARKYLIDQLSDGILVFDNDDRLLDVNPAAFIMLETDKSIIGRRVESLSRLSPVLETLLSNKSAYIEMPLTVSGEERFYELRTMTMNDRQNEQIGWLLILHDITDRKHRELEYKTIIQTTSDGFWLTDMEGRFLDVNDAYCRLTGYSRDELLGMSISDIDATEKTEDIVTRISLIRKNGGDRFETRHRGKDGRLIDVEVSVNYLKDQEEQMIVFIRDITERKRITDRMRELSNAVAQSVDGVVTININGRISFANKAYAHIHGYEPAEISGMQFKDFFIEHYKDMYKKNREDLYRDGAILTETIHRRKDGTEVPIFWSATLLKDEDGNHLGVVAIARDLTEQKRAEEAVRGSNARTTDLIGKMQNAVYVYKATEGGENFVITEFNQAGQRYQGKLKEEVIGKLVTELNPRAREVGLLKAVQSVYRTGQPLYFAPSIYKSPQGGPDTWREVWIYRLSSGEVVTEYSNITELKQAEKKMRELYHAEQKLRTEMEEEAKARGLFINVLAHELKTPLTPMRSSIEMLEETLDLDVKSTEHKLIKIALSSISTLVSRLNELLDLARFSRGEVELNLQPLNVRGFLKSIVAQFEPQIQELKQQIIFDVTQNLPQVEADYFRLEQVLTNLLSNASRFSEQGTEIALRAFNRENYVVIEVEDKGAGLTQAEQERLFNPYHRVEQDRQHFHGLGLAIAVSKLIIEAHGGEMWIQSEKGRGSTFSFSLPTRTSLES